MNIYVYEPFDYPSDIFLIDERCVKEHVFCFELNNDYVYNMSKLEIQKFKEWKNDIQSQIILLQEKKSLSKQEVQILRLYEGLVSDKVTTEDFIWAYSDYYDIQGLDAPFEFTARVELVSKLESVYDYKKDIFFDNPYEILPTDYIYFVDEYNYAYIEGESEPIDKDECITDEQYYFTEGERMNCTLLGRFDTWYDEACRIYPDNQIEYNIMNRLGEEPLCRIYRLDENCYVCGDLSISDYEEAEFFPTVAGNLKYIKEYLFNEFDFQNEVLLKRAVTSMNYIKV